MPKAYKHKPCRGCGEPKDADANGRIAGFYCSKCRTEVWKKYVRNLCGSKADNHKYWDCLDCRRVKRDRQRESAARGAATRAKNNPRWQKPFNAEKFWQSRAHAAVQSAIKHGLLPQLKNADYACVDCGALALEYDHRDYGRPLDVDPVCRSCNHKRGTAIWPSAERYDFKRFGPAPAKEGEAADAA